MSTAESAVRKKKSHKKQEKKIAILSIPQQITNGF
jgi:hypothetical protein